MKNAFIAVTLILILCGCASTISIVDWETGNRIKVQVPSGYGWESVAYINEKEGYFVTLSLCDNDNRVQLLRWLNFKGETLESKIIPSFGKIMPNAIWTPNGQQAIWYNMRKDCLELYDMKSGKFRYIEPLKGDIELLYYYQFISPSRILFSFASKSKSKTELGIYDDNRKTYTCMYKYDIIGHPKRFFISSSSSLVYIVDDGNCRDTNYIKVIDLNSGKIIKKILIDDWVLNFAVNEKKREMYVYTTGAQLLRYDFTTDRFQLIKQYGKRIIFYYIHMLPNDKLLCQFDDSRYVCDSYFYILDPKNGNVLNSVYCDPHGEVFFFDKGRKSIVETNY